jgi:hypothetical protein
MYKDMFWYDFQKLILAKAPILCVPRTQFVKRQDLVVISAFVARVSQAMAWFAQVKKCRNDASKNLSVAIKLLNILL